MLPKLFFKMDSAIIGFVEKFAHRFQRLTGKTNFFLLGLIAGILLIPSFIGMLKGTSMFDPMNPEPPEKTSFDYMTDFMRIYVLSEVAIFEWKIEEDAALRRLSQGLANPRKGSVGWALCRTLFFQVFILGTLSSIRNWNLLSAAIEGCVSLILYLYSCDPLPPCQGKIKEWLGSLFAKSATESG
jgi:hypothetical protein